MWANSRSSLVQGQSDASLTVAVGGGGGGAGVEGLSVLQQRKMRKLPRYTQSHRVLGMKTWLKLNFL
jgi:hypothetical protein